MGTYFDICWKPHLNDQARENLSILDELKDIQLPPASQEIPNETLAKLLNVRINVLVREHIMQKTNAVWISIWKEPN